MRILTITCSYVAYASLALTGNCPRLPIKTFKLHRGKIIELRL